MSSSLKKKVYHIKDLRIVIVLLGLFITGLALRLYRLPEYTIFLGDQGRDAIIMKRIVMFEHFPLVGAPSSVGQVYLGPFYYYFIAPWLALFNYNPIGPAIGVAIISSIAILIMYFAVADLFNKKTAIIAATLFTFSSVIVNYSRFSWNPNLLSVFSIITFYFFLKALDSGKRKHYVLLGIFIAIMFQLHYVTLSIIAAFCIIAAIHFFRIAHFSLQQLKNVVVTIVAFLMVNSPLIIFDFRHNFINMNNFIKMFQMTKSGSGIHPALIMDGFSTLGSYAFNMNVSGILMIILLILCVVFVKAMRNQQFNLLLFTIVISTITVLLMTTNKIPHYFGALYPLFYILIATIIVHALNKIPTFISYPVFTILISCFIFIQIPHYDFIEFRNSPGNQISHAEKTAKKIFPIISADKYRVTGVPEYIGTYMYEYYLELWGKTPVKNDTLVQADEMFVICESECSPIGYPQWNISFFKPRKIATSFRSDHIFVYKLIK